MTLLRGVVGLVRIDMRDARRCTIGRVMVQHDDIEPGEFDQRNKLGSRQKKEMAISVRPKLF